jgi:hypothetical protein
MICTDTLLVGSQAWQQAQQQQEGSSSSSRLPRHPWALTMLRLGLWTTGVCWGMCSSGTGPCSLRRRWGVLLLINDL